MNLLKTIALISILGSLGACASYSKVNTGQQSIEGLKFNVAKSSNLLSAKYGTAQQWSREGVSVDRLLIYSGVENAISIQTLPPGSKEKPTLFIATMQPDQLVSMFEQMYRSSGYDFENKKTDLTEFGGKRGVRFEFSAIRKSDNVRMTGLGYASVHANKLYAMVYHAPRLHFYPRDSAEMEAATGVTRYTLARHFRAALGTSPYRYLIMRRLDRVRSLIRAGAPLADAACACGFADQSHMTRHFKKAYGLPPGRWAALST